MSRGATWTVVLAAFLAVAAGAAVQHYLATTHAAAPLPAVNGYVLPRPSVLTPAMLVDDRGRPFSTADFAGHWSFVYLGYTYCPDVCPLALVELANVKKRLAAHMPDVPVTFYFVSVDPARDTPKRLHDYASYFDPDFRGLTGSVSDLTQFATETGSVFLIPEGQGPTGYIVNHSSNVVVLDPDGRLAAVITPPHTPDGIVLDFGKIVAYRGT